MFPQVERLLHLLLVSPTNSCEAERSFSALRRIETWLRLNHDGVSCPHGQVGELSTINRSLNSSSIDAPTLVARCLENFDIVRLMIMLMILKNVAIYTIVDVRGYLVLICSTYTLV